MFTLQDVMAIAGFCLLVITTLIGCTWALASIIGRMRSDIQVIARSLEDHVTDCTKKGDTVDRRFNEVQSQIREVSKGYFYGDRTEGRKGAANL